MSILIASIYSVMYTSITKALDLDSDSKDDVGKHSTQSTSEDSDPASGTEDVLDTKTVVTEGDAEDIVIEDDTTQSTDGSSEPQSGAEELIVIEYTNSSD